MLAPLAGAQVAPSAELQDAYLLAPCAKIGAPTGIIELELVEVEVARSKIKKWIKNQLKAITSDTPNIIDKRKVKFPATIRWVIDGVRCESAADIRLTGDWKDHLAFDNRTSHPVSSIAVRLRDQHIGNITRFKLLLPRTRNGNMEILATTVFSQFGFLAPKTHMQKARINGADFTLLFQEVPAKEMLEAASLRESLMIEGDERAIWELVREGGEALWSEVHGFALPDNAKWIANPIAETIALDALGRYARLYANYLANIGKDLVPPSQLRVANDFILDESLFVLVSRYLGASHGLRPHNRKFYYDPIYQQFRPIYYDGNPAPFSEALDIDPSHFLISDFERVQAIFSTPKSREEIFNNFARRGGEISRENIEKLFDLIISANSQLLQAAQDQLANNVVVPTAAPISRQWDIAAHLKQHGLADQQFIGFDTNAQNYQRCQLNSGEQLICEVLDQNASADYLRDPRGPEGESVPLVGSYTQSSPTSIELPALPAVSERVLNPSAGEYRIAPGESVWWHFDETATAGSEFAVALETESDLTGRLIVSGVVPPAASFNVASALGKIDSAVRYDSRLLTSCLTFVDARLQDNRIESHNAACEDGVNFLRVHGHVESLLVANAAADALDADFSRMSFGSINVTDAGNDCIDLSMGLYRIAELNATRCADKGVSVGEQAQVAIHKFNISEAVAGAVAKDGARLILGNGTMSAVASCLQAYRKKQEFDGALIQAPEALREACSQAAQVQQGSAVIYE